METFYFLSEPAYNKLDKLVMRYSDMNYLIVQIIIALEYITSAFTTWFLRAWFLFHPRPPPNLNLQKIFGL